MDEDVSVVEHNSIDTIATSLLTTEDMEAAEETEDIGGSSSTPPTSTEIHAALDVLRRSLDIRGATLEEFRFTPKTSLEKVLSSTYTIDKNENSFNGPIIGNLTATSYVEKRGDR
ncbi:hypothetical protein QE152_g21821 [Popillia japonica]|uniref:Uncharacterized protein n=1 Tax=Popillia japonica TaxID=7064 RepID=A0AAW1KN04_POPJA